MAAVAKNVAVCDPIWSALREQAEALASQEPALASFVHGTILKHHRLEEALSYHLARKIGCDDVSPTIIREIFEETMSADESIGQAVRTDLSAVFERDPACHTHVEAFLFYKGFHALQSYRIAHWLWTQRRHPMALLFQSRVSELFDVDIHPAARLGRGIMIDHATGVVIGETAVVDDDVSMLHGVTLGGTGKEEGDRHPQDPPRRAALHGRQDSRQYRDRRIFTHWRGQRCIARRAAAQHGRGRARTARGTRRGRATFAGNEPDARRYRAEFRYLGYSASNSLNQVSAAATSGLRSSVPPGKGLAGTRANVSNFSDRPRTASAISIPPSVASATP